ncbi:MAG: sodium:calcium antiporter [Phycisphaeraceae bacterium]
MLALLPHAWHDWVNQQSTLILLVIVVVATAAVIKGADWIVDAAATLARRLGLPQVVIGATIVSLGTTSPEAAVSVMAAWAGESGIALGNGVGSIIVDSGLILGLGLLLTRVPANAYILNRQGWVQFGSGALLCAICYGLFLLQGDAATISRAIGLLLVTLLVVYMAVSVHWSRSLQGAALPAAAAPEPEQEQDADAPARTLAPLLLLGVLGLAIVVVGSDALVGSASELALRWGVPSVVLAATLVAFGTSMPELVVGLTAIRRGHGELMLGNIIGADILNVLFVVGAAALAQPLPVVDFDAATGAQWRHLLLQLHLPVMLSLLVLLRVFTTVALKRGHFPRWMGVPLLVAYVAYVAVQLITVGR